MASHRSSWNTDLQNRARTFLTENAEHFSEVASVLFESFIDGVSDEIEELEDEIATLKSKIDDRDSRIDEMSEEITALEQRIEDLED